MSEQTEKLENGEGKLYKYTYIDRLDKNKVVFEYVAKDILEADKAYQEKTGNDPRKQNNIGCSLKPAEEIESLG